MVIVYLKQDEGGHYAASNKLLIGDSSGALLRHVFEWLTETIRLFRMSYQNFGTGPGLK